VNVAFVNGALLNEDDEDDDDDDDKERLLKTTHQGAAPNCRAIDVKKRSNKN